MYILVHFLASSFPDEKLDTVWNHWLPVSTAMFCARTKLDVNSPKDGRGISQKQVLFQNLSSTDVHGRTSVERYTDVQQSKMVQYGCSSSLILRVLILAIWCVYPSCNIKMCEILSKISHTRKATVWNSSATVAMDTQHKDICLSPVSHRIRENARKKLKIFWKA